MLSSIFFLPLIGSLIVSMVENELVQKRIALSVSFLTFFLSLVIWILHNASYAKLQFLNTFFWLDFYNLFFLLGVDGLSIFFVVLTAFLFVLCFLSAWSAVKVRQKEFLVFFLVLETLLLGVFLVTDVIWFYILFESVLIPMFALIGLAGSRERKIRAAFMFFIYTVVGSLLMLLAVIYLQICLGVTSFETLSTVSFSIIEQKFLWFSFFLAFAGKIPMFPLHVWLPEAHVEAPTSGSVILAGILLKLGSYGLIRVSVGLFSEASLYFIPFVFSLSCLGLIFASLTAIRQTDLKRIIAYTSVGHMNLVVLGIFSLTIQGVEGALLQSLSHGFVSSALFFCIGVIYDRYHSRLLAFYSGITFIMPFFISLFLFFNFANIALPGTSNFVGEFLLLSGIFKINSWACFVSSLGMILSAAYALWFFNRFAYGNFNYALKPTRDLVLREHFVLWPLAVCVVIVGVFPEIVLKEFRFLVLNLFS